MIFEKRLHFLFFACQAKPNSSNTPKEHTSGIGPMLQTFTGIHVWAVAQIPRGIQMSDRCLTSPHCCWAARNHRNKPILSKSMFQPVNSLRYYTPASGCAYTYPCQQLVLKHEWESQTVAASLLGLGAETYGRIKGTWCYFKPSNSGEFQSDSVTTFPISSSHRSRDRIFHPEGQMETQEL